MASDTEKQFEFEPPSERVVQYALNYLNENPTTRADQIQQLRELIYVKDEFKPHRSDESFMLRFLRAREFNVDKAYILMKKYYYFKENNPEIHKNVHPLSLTYIGDDEVISVPANRDQIDRRIMIFRIGKWNPNLYNAYDIFKAAVVILEIFLNDYTCQIMGGVCIFDFENLGFKHIRQITPNLAKKMIQFMTTSFPVNIQAVHIVNQPMGFDLIFKLFKPLLDKAMTDRIHFHGTDFESLQKFVSRDSLPERYGGTRPDYNFQVWLNALAKDTEIVKQLRLLNYLFNENEN